LRSSGILPVKQEACSPLCSPPGLLVALLDSTIPVFMSRIVTLITAGRPEELFSRFWPHLSGMALVLLVARPFALTMQNLIANQAITANVSNRIRWQNHWYVVRQSWAFFQNDFAGRIANRVMQTGPAIRETLVALLTSVWYIMVYGTTAMILLASADPVLALPVALRFAGYLLMLCILVPRSGGHYAALWRRQSGGFIDAGMQAAE
jgi:ATP-binding cassette, subfamily B, multidrug efflux pump